MNKVSDLIIFKVGTWNGEPYTEADLDNMAKSFNSDEPIPLIIGHSSDYKGHTRIPVFGRILGGLKRVGQDLVAMGVEFNEKLAEWVREGFYPQRSIELTKDNKRVLAVGMLGAAPPAVKGLPGNDEALQEIALQFAEMQDNKVVEFALDVEALAVDDTFKSLSATCMKFLETIEKMLVDGMEPEKLSTQLWEMQADMCEALNLHEQFLKKIEQIETRGEMTSRLSGWEQFKEKLTSLFNKRKETEMEAQKEKEYQEQIAARDAQIKEFQEKERIAAEAKAKADKEAIEAAQKAKDEQVRSEVKTFCEQAIKDNKMTPAERETDEAIMVGLASNPEALKSFQAKYSRPVVPVGEMRELNQPPAKPKSKLDLAADYVKAHPAEFAELSPELAIARAIFRESNKEIKF
jgi:hypothetical protein